VSTARTALLIALAFSTSACGESPSDERPELRSLDISIRNDSRFTLQISLAPTGVLQVAPGATGTAITTVDGFEGDTSYFHIATPDPRRSFALPYDALETIAVGATLRWRGNQTGDHDAVAGQGLVDAIGKARSDYGITAKPRLTHELAAALPGIGTNGVSYGSYALVPPAEDTAVYWATPTTAPDTPPADAAAAAFIEDGWRYQALKGSDDQVFFDGRTTTPVWTCDDGGCNLTP
jgi:hypothetical protein